VVVAVAAVAAAVVLWRRRKRERPRTGLQRGGDEDLVRTWKD